MQQSVANARAELPVPSSVETTPGLSASAAGSQDHGGASTPGATPQRSLVASRWPDAYSGDPSSNLPPNKPDPGTVVNTIARTQPTSILTAGQFAAADISSETPHYSVQMQLAALTGMLALAGLMGTVIFKFGSSRQLQPSRISRPRGPIWQSTDDDRIVLSSANGFARDHNQSAERSERIAEFFTQITGRAPT